MRGWRDVPALLDVVTYAIAGRKCSYRWCGTWRPGTLQPNAIGADGRRIVRVLCDDGASFSGGTSDVFFEELD